MTKKFGKLIAFELEEYMAFPIPEMLVLIAVYSILSPPLIEYSPAGSYVNLVAGVENVFLFLIFASGAIFCRSFAGSLAKGETKLLLSYPVERKRLFISKFTALFTIFLIVYLAVFSIQVYLQVLSPFEPLFYISLSSIVLQLLLVCTITTAFSLLVRNEIIAILGSILLLFGLESLAGSTSILSSAGRFRTVFAYFSQSTHGSLPSGIGFLTVPSTLTAICAILIPIAISAVLLCFSYAYYTKKMEID